jgi:hypothetical protein
MNSNRGDSSRKERGVLARLLDCHERIRETIDEATRIGHAPSQADAVAVALEVARYFTRGLPMHTRDEEDSILPRLAGVGAVLDRVRAEHEEHEPMVQALVRACRDLVDRPTEWADLRPTVAEAAATLSPVMLRHLEGEERDLFPHLDRLDPTAQAHVLEEMDRRRRR